MGIQRSSARDQPRGAPHHESAGLTLVEILVAIAIVAILASVLSPLVVKHIQSGRIARARSDAQALAQAIQAFQLDVGRWPVSSDGTAGGTEDLSRLVGLAAGDLAPEQIPGGAGSADGDSAWQGGGDGGVPAPLVDLLVYNRTEAADPAYPLPVHTGEPGWRGPYLDRIPLDPWGHPYVCNVRYLAGANVAGVTAEEAADHAVYCLSAGPNQQFETAFADATPLGNQPGGDDVGSLIQPRGSRGASAASGSGDSGSCGIIGLEPVVLLWAGRRWRRRAHRRRHRAPA